MTILDRYILRTILGTTTLVMFGLMSLAVFVDFLAQLGEIGNGNYGLREALAYTALRSPELGVQLLPAAALLGALLGLGILASRSELIVMQTAGFSRRQLARSVLVTGVLLMLLATVVGEYFAPALASYARQMRALARYAELVVDGENVWVRDGDLIFQMRQVGEVGVGAGVYLYELDGQGGLRAMGRAQSVAATDDPGLWRLDDYAQTRFDGGRVTGSVGSRVIETQRFTEDLLFLSTVRPADLDARGLWRYVAYLRADGLDSTQYEIAFWSRLAHIVSAAVMPLLALPFVFGSLRAAGAGARMLVGLMIGLGYFLVSRVLADGAVVFDVDPLWMAWTPIAVLFVGALWGLARTR